MQQSSEHLRELKIQLLQTEIIDAGYDHLAFQVYCEQVKKDGSDDIDQWDYDELKDTIRRFIERENLTQEKIKQRSEEQFNTPTAGSGISEIKQQQPQSQAFVSAKKIIDDVNFAVEIEAKFPSRSPLYDFIQENEHKVDLHLILKQIEVLMNEYIVKQEGFLSTAYGAFRVETKPLGWSVWRRFSDFVWLRQTLAKAFPLSLIPPIPRKKIRVNATDSAYLQKRQRVMELFLQSLIHNPLYRTHPALSDFLQIVEEVKFKDKMSVYDKQPAPTKPSEFISLNGLCQLEISERLKNYSGTLQDYLKNSNEIYKKMGHNFKKLFVDLDSLSTTLSVISENFTGLSKVTELFCSTIKEEVSGELNQINQVYGQLSNLMQGWHQGTIFQMKNVKENFYEFFRFHRKMQDQANQYLQQRNQMAAKFNDIKTKLNDKKEKLFLAGDVSKWEMGNHDCPLSNTELQHNKTEAFKYMLQNETKALEQHREQYAFINRKLPDEMNEIMGFRSKVYIKKFLRVAHMRALETAKLHHCLADFLQNLSEMQGLVTAQLQRRSNSIYIDSKYDQYFGMNPSQIQ